MMSVSTFSTNGITARPPFPGTIHYVIVYVMCVCPKHESGDESIASALLEKLM